MNDEDLDHEEPVTDTSPNVAAARTLALGSASREAADAFLESQTAVARLQKEHLHEQRALLVSNLKWRRFNNRMHGAVQILLALTGLLILGALSLLLWNASHAAGLEVDAFSAPPDFEQRGAGGEVIAADITQRLSDIRNTANAHSYSTSNDVSSGRNEIKVEIPETGISLAEAWRLLKNWLGHERHVTGNLRESAGSLTLSATLDGAAAASATGKPSDLPLLEQRVAEGVFGSFDPVNIVNYYSATRRHREAYAAAARYLTLASTTVERCDSYGLFGTNTVAATGDYELGLARLRYGMAIDPQLAVVRVVAMRYERILGRDEDAVRQARIVLTLKEADQTAAHRGRGFAQMLQDARSMLAVLTGDFAAAPAWACYHDCALVEPFGDAAIAARLHDPEDASKRIALGHVEGFSNPQTEAEAEYYIAGERQDWATALRAAEKAFRLSLVPDGDQSSRAVAAAAADVFGMKIAEAEAHLGNFAVARAEIADTPTDCVPCDVKRGDIAALERRYDAAGFWYARADALAPSIPFADTQWGAMLLQMGRYDAAIVKLRAAHAKSPRYADPLELWGEALMQEDRSDLALAKFAEAAQYAPNWSRLHLEWTKALRYARIPPGTSRGN